MENIMAIALPIVKSIAFAIITAAAGMIFIKWLTKRLNKLIEHSKLDVNLKPIFLTLLNFALKILLVLTVIRILGIDTTSFVAVIGAASLAVGLAFQGSLSNFAGGVLLLTLRPFKVGDFIEANNFKGIVQAVQILYTEIVTPDNKVIFIPNGVLSNSSIINYSVKDIRRVDLEFNVGYKSDNSRVVAVLQDIVDKHDLILHDMDTLVKMFEHSTNSLVYIVRVWVNAPDYWLVYYDLIETVKKRFDEENIAIPYPQLKVHLDTN